MISEWHWKIHETANPFGHLLPEQFYYYEKYRGGGVFITFLGRNWWIATQAIYQVSLFAVIHLDPGWIEVLWEQNTLHIDLAKCTNLAHSNLSLVNQLTDH